MLLFNPGSHTIGVLCELQSESLFVLIGESLQVAQLLKDPVLKLLLGLLKALPSVVDIL